MKIITSLTWFEKAFSMTIQRNDQYSSLHMVVTLDAHFWQRKCGGPTEIFRINTILNRKKYNTIYFFFSIRKNLSLDIEIIPKQMCIIRCKPHRRQRPVQCE